MATDLNPSSRRVLGFPAGWIGRIASTGFAVAVLLKWMEASVDSLKIGNGHARADLGGFNRRMTQHFL